MLSHHVQGRGRWHWKQIYFFFFPADLDLDEALTDRLDNDAKSSAAVASVGTRTTAGEVEVESLVLVRVTIDDALFGVVSFSVRS
jgi:hypothetical protein